VPRPELVAALAAGQALGELAGAPAGVVALVRLDGLRVAAHLVVAGADLLEPRGEPRAGAQGGGQRRRGLMGAQQARDVQTGDVLAPQGLRHRPCLLVAEGGEPRTGIARIEDALDIAGGLAMTDQEKSHARHRTRSRRTAHGLLSRSGLRSQPDREGSVRGEHLDAIPGAVTGMEAQIPREGRALAP